MFRKPAIYLLFTVVTVQPYALPAELTRDCLLYSNNTIISASVKEHNNYAELSWSTTTNEQIDHFEVERKETGGEFKTIALVMSSNLSNTESYLFKDKLTGAESAVQYRIKVLFSDGSINYSSITALTIATVTETIIKFTPNPVVATTALNLPSIKGTYLCRVYDMDGQLLMVSRVHGKHQSLNIQSLQSGNYFVEAFHPQTGKRYYGHMTKQ